MVFWLGGQLNSIECLGWVGCFLESWFSVDTLILLVPCVFCCGFKNACSVSLCLLTHLIPWLLLLFVLFLLLLILVV